MSRYRLHEVLVAQARPSAGLGRLAGGVGLIILGFMVLNISFYRMLEQLPDWPAILHEMRSGGSPRALWIMLANFLPLLIVLALVLNLLHQRGLRTLLGPRILVTLDLRRVLRPLIVLFGIVMILPKPEGFAPVAHTAFGSWVLLAPVSLVLIALQVSTEELLFRGYLQSQLAARFRSPVAWILVPSLLFGALHFDPVTYGENAMPLAIWSFLFALAAADLTARSGNLGAAIALHLVNNVSALMIVATQGYWDGLAWFVVPFGPGDTDAVRSLLPLEALMLLCSWLVARIAIRR